MIAQRQTSEVARIAVFGAQSKGIDGFSEFAFEKPLEARYRQGIKENLFRWHANQPLNIVNIRSQRPSRRGCVPVYAMRKPKCPGAILDERHGATNNSITKAQRMLRGDGFCLLSSVPLASRDIGLPLIQSGDEHGFALHFAVHEIIQRVGRARQWVGGADQRLELAGGKPGHEFGKILSACLGFLARK